MPTKFFLALLISLMFIDSSSGKAEELTPYETVSIRSVISDFYKTAQGGKNYRNMDISLISEELNVLIQLAKVVEKRSAQQIKMSNMPTDKPLLIEGAIFTPYYEGYSKLLSIEDARKTKSTYFAEVKLVYDREQPTLTWTDTVVVVIENGHWKVDDILFHGIKPSEAASVKQILRSFACRCLPSEAND